MGTKTTKVIAAILETLFLLFMPGASISQKMQNDLAPNRISWHSQFSNTFWPRENPHCSA